MTVTDVVFLNATMVPAEPEDVDSGSCSTLPPLALHKLASATVPFSDAGTWHTVAARQRASPVCKVQMTGGAFKHSSQHNDRNKLTGRRHTYTFECRCRNHSPSIRPVLLRSTGSWDTVGTEMS